MEGTVDAKALTAIRANKILVVSPEAEVDRARVVQLMKQMAVDSPGAAAIAGARVPNAIRAN
jgi:hypothetical protein